MGGNDVQLGRAVHAHSDVCLPSQQIVGVVRGDQLNLDVRVFVMQLRQDLRQKERGHDLARGDPHRSRKPAVHFRCAQLCGSIRHF